MRIIFLTSSNPYFDYWCDTIKKIVETFKKKIFVKLSSHRLKYKLRDKKTTQMFTQNSALTQSATNVPLCMLLSVVMAIYHCAVKMITRANGHSAVSACAYRRGIELKDERTGIRHDYTRKRNVVHSEIMIPRDAPLWIQEIDNLQKTDPSQAAGLLWNSAEQTERRTNSRLSREIEFALPKELDQQACIALTREVAQTLCNEGMVVDFNIHWDSGNPHAHLMLSTRRLAEQGWGDKVRAWDHKTFLLSIRSRIAEIVNAHLAQAGIDKRVSHLSYAEQGIDILPTVHEGSRIAPGHHYARARNAEIGWLNLKKMVQDPEAVLVKLQSQTSCFSLQDVAASLHPYLQPANADVRLGSPVAANEDALSPALRAEPRSLSVNEPLPASLPQHPTMDDATTPVALTDIIQTLLEKLSKTESVFNERTLRAALERHVQHPEVVARALAQIKHSPNLLAIGPGEDGRERYTTREMFDLENGIEALAGELNQQFNHRVSGRTANHFIKAFKLKEEQAKGIRHILKGADICALVGRAGTGKSYSLKAARAAWEAAGFNVHGVALAGIAADNLENDSGIASQTIESFCCALEAGSLVLTDKDILVMDEAGMTDSISFSKVMTAIAKARAKLVLVGDPDQLQPVGPGALFRALLERIGFAELSTIVRQEEAWQREATAYFAAGDIPKALGFYESHGCIALSKTREQSLALMIEEWHQTLQTGAAITHTLLLAYQNIDVDALNQLARTRLIAEGRLSNGDTLTTSKGVMEISLGERVMFLKNHRLFQVRNGQRGTVIGIERDADQQVVGIQVEIELDWQGNRRVVTINPTEYREFTYGYASTVHRAQGVTVLHTFTQAAGRWTRSLIYVAMSRHKKSARLYASKETYASLEPLKKQMARPSLKDSVLDYPLAFAARRGIEVDNASSIQQHLTQKMQWMLQSLKNNFEQTFFPGRYWEKKAQEAEKNQKSAEILQRREDARMVAAYVDANRLLGQSWEALHTHQQTVGIDIDAPRSEQEAVWQDPLLLSAVQAAQAHRNALAATLYERHGYYTEALKLYDISVNTLAAQRERHFARERVLQYGEEVNRGRTVHRDKLASLIQRDIKLHYGALQTLKVSLPDLKAHAKAHDRRALLRTLSPEERADFRKVEHYITLSRHSGALWKTLKEQESQLTVSALIAVDDLKPYEIGRLQALAKTGKPLSRALLMQARAMSEARDALAAELVPKVERYRTACTFYEVGVWQKAPVKKPKPKPSEPLKLTEFAQRAEQFAKERLTRLTQQAARFTQQQADIETIKQYLQRLNKPVDAKRLALAGELMVNKSRITRLMFASDELSSLSCHPLEDLRTLHQDAKLYAQQALLKDKPPDTREAFAVVESYRQQKRTLGKIWGESQNVRHPVIEGIRAPYALLRDELAHKIEADLPRYREALTFFNLQDEDFSRHAWRHRLREQSVSDKEHTKTVLAHPLPPISQPEPDAAFGFRMTLSYADREAMEYVTQIVQESVPYNETLVERYLTEHLGIQNPAFKNVRYHPSVYEPASQRHYPALIAPAYNWDKKPQAMQCLYLNADTGDKIPTPTRICGPVKGSSVLLQAGKSQETALVIDLETGLRVAQDKQLTVYAALEASNIGFVPLPFICKSVSLFDANPSEPMSEAIDRLSIRGLTVHCMTLAQQTVKPAFNLEQFVSPEHQPLAYEILWPVIEFRQTLQQWKKVSQHPTDTDAMLMYRKTGAFALLIEQEPFLLEAVKRHELGATLTGFIREYREHVYWSLEAEKCALRLNSQDPVADFIQGKAHQETLKVPWLSPSPEEKEKWRTVSKRVQQLAFIIEQNPRWVFQAKEQGVFNEVKSQARQYRHAITHEVMLRQDTGIER